MVALELRDPVAGVLARSFRREDCQHFLRCCIARKQHEAAELRGIDPFALAAIEAETERLRSLLRLLDRRIPYAEVE
jgi:hypothetical protein